MYIVEWFPERNHCTAIRFEGRLATELINTLHATKTTQKNHIKNKFNKILDLIISNVTITTTRIPGIVKEDDYHPPLHMIIDLNNIKFIESNKTPKLNFFRADFVTINRELSNII